MGEGGQQCTKVRKLTSFFVFVAQNFLNGTSFELSPAPHMFHCRYERKLFYEQIFTRKTFLDVYKYMCLKWFIGIISVPIVMPCDLFRNSSLCYIICNFSILLLMMFWIVQSHVNVYEFDTQRCMVKYHCLCVVCVNLYILSLTNRKLSFCN